MAPISITRSSAKGSPILTFAPAGLQSVIAVWSQPFRADQPDHRMGRELSRDRDGSAQRRRPIARTRSPRRTDGIATPLTHIALLDHLRIDRCHLYGQCIGGSFILNLIKAQPERVQSAVLAQPIGRVGAMAPGRPARFDGWAETLKDHPEAAPQVLDAFCRNLYAPGFVYCGRRAFVSTVRTPCLVLAGNDEAAPLPDLRGAFEAAPELRVHCGVEGGCGSGLGKSPRQGVSRQAYPSARDCRRRSGVADSSPVSPR